MGFLPAEPQSAASTNFATDTILFSFQYANEESNPESPDISRVQRTASPLALNLTNRNAYSYSLHNLISLFFYLVHPEGFEPSNKSGLSRSRLPVAARMHTVGMT